jgi:sugar O-acyltransferase (sialic acid O-acetyltransferase NeuD family)
VKTERVFVYGAGGHGKVVADILISKGCRELAGFVDDREELRGTNVLGLPVLGNGEWLLEEAANSCLTIALGVGDNSSRHSIMERCSRSGIEVVTLVHPAATVARSAHLGRGTVVMAGAIINPKATIGTAVIVNTGAVLEHDVNISDYAHVAPKSAMGGASGLGAFSHLGMGATVLQCVQIGSHTIVGAGAVVVKDLPDQVMAIGVPARIRRHLKPDDLSIETATSKR